jgi:pimeloyl-ACP methyl ester carboxylesterase
VVIGFGGNAWHAEGLVLDLRRHFPDRTIVAFDYRGYRPSTGSPSAAALLADSLLIHDYVRDYLQPKHVIAVGYSLGSGVAGYLARERPLAGIILVTPFDSLEAVAAQHYPWAPVRWMFRHRMPTADFLSDLKVPVAVIAAERDEVVPPARTAALRHAVNNLVFDRTIIGARHNDIFRHPDFAKAMPEALDTVGPR